MGIIQLDAYVLLVSGHDRYSFLDGLSTNKVDQSCSTVLTTTSAKIIDVVDVIEVGENLAVVGYGPYKEDVLAHLQPRILQQNVTIRDISSLNHVYVSTEEYPAIQGITVSKSYLGWIMVTSTNNPLEESMSMDDFTDYRTRHSSHIKAMKSLQTSIHSTAVLSILFMKRGCYIGQEILTRMKSSRENGQTTHQGSNKAEDATSVGYEFSLLFADCPHKNIIKFIIRISWTTSLRSLNGDTISTGFALYSLVY